MCQGVQPCVIWLPQKGLEGLNGEAPCVDCTHGWTSVPVGPWWRRETFVHVLGLGVSRAHLAGQAQLSCHYCHLNYTYAEQGDRVLGRQLCPNGRLKGLVFRGWLRPLPFSFWVLMCFFPSCFSACTLSCTAVDLTCCPCGAWFAGNRDTVTGIATTHHVWRGKSEEILGFVT